MKIQYISDIHTEFLSATLQIPGVVRHIRLGVPDADILILAGDIGSYMSMEKIDVFLGLICPLYKHVIYVLGNHEYYALYTEEITAPEIQQAYRELERVYKNLTVLIDEDVLIEGLVIAGTTLWFDTSNPFAITQSGYLNDFRRIPGGMQAIQSMSMASMNYIADLVNGSAGTRIDLLVTHHGVSPVVHPNFAGDMNNVYYYQDITAAIEKLDIGRIIHGHQHDGVEYDLPCNVPVEERRVKVSTNCKGYPEQHPLNFSYGKYLEL